jgi:hypothetical protein
LKPFAFALFASLVFSVAPGIAPADPTPTPAPSATAPAPLPRFGYVHPVARDPSYQTSLEAFVADVSAQLQEGLTAKAVLLPDVGLQDAINPANCAANHLSGFILSQKNWHGGRVVQVQATVQIVDCNGNAFAQGDGSASEQRDRTMDVQGQVEAIQPRAIERAVSSIVDFKTSHESAWAQLVSTGHAAAAK